MTPQEIKTILSAALAAPYVAAPVSGCGRAYVVIYGDKTVTRALPKIAKELGLIYSKSLGIYIGYDNADGRALGRAKAVATELKKAGLKAYDDAQAD